MKKKLVGFLLVMAVCIVASVIGCKEASPVAPEKTTERTSIAISVQLPIGGSGSGRSIYDDPNVSSVFVEVFNASGDSIGSGALSKSDGYWHSVIQVSQTGSASFQAWAKDSGGENLYYGQIGQTLSGSGDLVTIPVLLTGSIQGTVVDSVGGSPVVNTHVSITSAGEPILGTLWTQEAVTDSEGAFGITGIPSEVFDITAQKAGCAGSKLQSVPVFQGGIAKVEMIQTVYNFNSQAVSPPTIHVLGLTAGDTFSGLVNITISVDTNAYPVADTYDHPSIALRIGDKGSLAFGAYSLSNSLEYSWNTSKYPPGNINVNIVAYDINNDRAELNLPVNVAISAGSAPSLAPSNCSIGAFTFGTSLGIFKKNRDVLLQKGFRPSSGGFPVPQRVFSAPDDSTVIVSLEAEQTVNTTGMGIYRSASQGGSYTLVGRTSYAFFNTTDQKYYYAFADSSSELSPNQTYWYTISYFNGYGKGPQTSPYPVPILPKYTLSLVAPANNSVITETQPTFQWASDTIAGAMRFDALYAAEVTGSGEAQFSDYVFDQSSMVCGTPLSYNRLYEWNIMSEYMLINGSVVSLSLPSSSASSINGAFYFTVVQPED
jgi:hypothetical protein